jgi:hypothetical protein
VGLRGLPSWQAIGLGGRRSRLQKTDLLGPGRFFFWALQTALRRGIIVVESLAYRDNHDFLCTL